MHGRPVPQAAEETLDSHPHRWRILGVLVLALLVTSIDHTIINVAIPEMVRDLRAGAAQLQWIVAAYTVVFAGLLLTAGTLGDRFGRRHALALGLITFMAGSILSAVAGSSAMLIAGRGGMGVGGALIMPTTLSILVNAFGDPRERAKAIATWTAASGAGIALGPIVGGLLMRSFSWSSVFWINVPLLAVALVGTLHLVPDSRDPHATRLDPGGAVLSIAAIGSLVYAVIEAPSSGWTSTSTVIGFMVAALAGGIFVRWELRRDEPMLDMRLFVNRGFSAGSLALAMLFFAMAGTVFLQAQYLQFILDYTPLVAGAALVPAALGMIFGTGAGAHLADHLGGRIAVVTGTLLSGAGVAVQAALIDGTSYVPTGGGLLLFGLGAGIAMPAATDLIMSTLPPARAGVGSAVNDTVRELGGALGVAVIGSVAASTYATDLQGQLDAIGGVPENVRIVATDNLGAALEATQHLGADGAEIAAAARDAFVSSMSGSLWVGVALAALATAIAYVHLPQYVAPPGRGSRHASGARVEDVHEVAREPLPVMLVPETNPLRAPAAGARIVAVAGSSFEFGPVETTVSTGEDFAVELTADDRTPLQR
jgi:EmrB/QacA subfamily drug resistance transporter